MEKHKGSRKGARKWTAESMGMAYKYVKCGRLSISAASKKYGVPRMTLNDRVKGRVPMNAKWGGKPSLTDEEETSLVEYIDYMGKRGFPLSIEQIKGFAWCIAKERGKGELFKKSGPSKKWWRGFKRRHPQLRLRRPDSLDRGRASMGNVYSLRDYFAILKDTLDTNGLHEKPHLIFNCDEAAINLNKSAGQRVVVTSKQKHVHSIAAATNEHITVHCCVNAAGSSIPPMVIFTKSFPGGAYHKKGPVNATYATSETGFMDSYLYLQWFEKTFLQFSPPERPLLLIQDGASSHTSCSLIKSAIANDVIILCLPPKTTHITQPLDVAVYRKMKIEAARIMSHAKQIKSDLWIAKKNVTAMFRMIYENSFTMRCITEGFRKCGIHPFNPNAIDKSLLLRSCDVIDEKDIDISVNNTAQDLPSTSTQDDCSTTTPMTLDRPLASSSPKQQIGDKNDVSEPLNITFLVGEDGILNLHTALDADVSDQAYQQAGSADRTETVTDCPPALALCAVECSLTPRKKRKYMECFNFEVDLPDDNVYQTWKLLKKKTIDEETLVERNGPSLCDQPEFIASKLPAMPAIPPNEKPTHPLVKAGLIPEDLADILVTPKFEKKINPPSKGKKKACILTSQEVEKELVEKEQYIKEKEERTRKNKEERELKKMERAMAASKKKNEMLIKKELREKIKTERERRKREKEARKVSRGENQSSKEV